MAVLPRRLPRTGAYQDYCPQARRRFVLIAAILASAMGFIDGTVVAIAIPAIRADLAAGLADVQWVNNAYMLALSALILVGGAAGDRYGLRRVFSAGILVFILASLACALAPGVQTLIAARAVQGAGAALMVPGSLAIISKTYPKGERSKAIGIWAAASALATAAGPILGGALLSLGPDWAWRLIFAINLPVGAVALYLLLVMVPEDAPVSDDRPDIAGAVLVTLALGLIAWGLTGPGGEGDAPDGGRALAFGGLGLALGAAFIAREAQAASPMMPLRLFARRAFSAANLLTFCLYFALSGILFYLPMALIGGWGLAEALVGAIFVPLTVAIALGSGPVGWLAARTGPGPLIALGALVVAVAFALLALGMGWRLFWAHVFLSMCLMGIGMALVVAPLSDAVMGAVEDADAGAASGINNAVARVAGLVAVAALGGVAASGYAAAGGPSGFGLSVSGPAVGLHFDAVNAGFSRVAWVTAALSAAAAVVAFGWLPRGAPAAQNPGAP